MWSLRLPSRWRWALAALIPALLGAALVLRWGGGREVRYVPDGLWSLRWGEGPGEIGRWQGRDGRERGPAGVALGPLGALAIADTAHGRLLLFGREGNLVAAREIAPALEGWRGRLVALTPGREPGIVFAVAEAANAVQAGGHRLLRWEVGEKGDRLTALPLDLDGARVEALEAGGPDGLLLALQRLDRAEYRRELHALDPVSGRHRRLIALARIAEDRIPIGKGGPGTGSGGAGEGEGRGPYADFAADAVGRIYLRQASKAADDGGIWHVSAFRREGERERILRLRSPWPEGAGRLIGAAGGELFVMQRAGSRVRILRFDASSGEWIGAVEPEEAAGEEAWRVSTSGDLLRQRATAEGLLAERWRRSLGWRWGRG